MAISYRTGKDAREGGLDITISLTAEESAAAGFVDNLGDWFDTALWALAILRSGRVDRTDGHALTAADLYTVINDLDHRLLPRLEGIRDAAVRRHAELGGTYGDLALAMDTSRSTAQYRRDALTAKSPNVWENWATGQQQD
ncbi:hypothetical protein OG530_41005 (plasmid) [Streptomyces decoyicus]|uniref:hypothetical protein n=1 Tax=Streptomyces decoyicus TaxID=249567 RepID=UPI002E175F99